MDYLFYYLKNDFENNSLEHPLIKDISSNSYGKANSHRGSSKYIVTDGLASFSHFTVAFKNQSESSDITSIHYYIPGFYPEKFAFNDKIMIDIVSSSSAYYWMIGLLHDRSYNTVYYIRRSLPNAIAIRDYVSNRTAAVYYSTTDSYSNSGYILVREIADLKYDISETVKASLGNN